MAWVELFALFALFAVSHLAGDYVLRTDWQATHKRGGLGADAVARRALLWHVTTYTSAFVPALLWIAGDLGAGALWVAALVAVPHFVQDDGRLVEWWWRTWSTRRSRRSRRRARPRPDPARRRAARAGARRRAVTPRLTAARARG